MSAPERMLAIDTSTEQAGLAVLRGERDIELRWTSGREQTVSVLDQIDRCLSLAGLTASELEAVAVAIGPGMFNGLRVGISLAKGFALSLGVPIIGISTLELTAAPWREIGAKFESDIVPVVAAGRGRVVFSRLNPRGEVADQPENATIDELISRIRDIGGRAMVVGEIPAERVQELEEAGAVVRAGRAFARNPVVLGELALARLRAGEQDDLVALEPVYIHGRSAMMQK